MQLTASSYSSPSCHLQGKRDTEQSKAASISHHFFREFLNSGGRSMDEEGTSSWLRRTNYSNTIYHRLDSSRLASVPLTLQPEVSSRLRRSLEAPSTSKRPVFSTTYIQYNPLTNKQRSVSPLPQTLVSETFKEALSASKRFSTPQTRRGESDKGIGGRKESRECHKSGAKLNRNPSSLKQFASLKIDRKSKKDSAWAKCFDHGGGRVTALEAADQYTVDLSKLFLGHKFAHGAHSRLHHGIYKDEPVAVKIITVPDDESNTPLGLQLEKEYNTEVSILSRLYHPHVIKFVAACRKPPVYFIVTEYLTEGSLRVYLHKLEHRTLPLKKLITCALEIARGMQYVHSQGVIHRDLKPENVLIDNEFHMKIADFGIACEEAYVDLLADDPGTYRWMAPEMIKRKLYGRKVDVYGFGLMLWEMVSGSIPYEDMNPIQAAYAVVNKNLRPPFPKDCPAAMRALIDQCWSSNPDRRPEFYQVVEVLELFESTIAKDGTLDSIQNMGFQDHKKGLLHWVQKLSSSNSSSMPKPKFS